jgi:excisionase family DNA binding protein
MLAGMDMDDLPGVPDAARELGISPARVRDFIREQRLPARKIGDHWIIRREDLALVAHRRTGRPPRKGRKEDAHAAP